MKTKSPYRDLERVVKKSIVASLFHLGVDLYVRNVAVMRLRNSLGKERVIRCGTVGMSDLWGTDNTLGWARHWEIEVKRRGEVPTTEQLFWLTLCNQRSCVAFWVDNVDTAVHVAKVILNGGRIIWNGTSNYDLEMPE